MTPQQAVLAAISTIHVHAEQLARIMQEGDRLLAAHRVIINILITLSHLTMLLLP